MQKVIVPAETFNKIINVLAQRPYAEVSGVMDEIQKSVTLEEDNASDGGRTEEPPVKEVKVANNE